MWGGPCIPCNACKVETVHPYIVCLLYTNDSIPLFPVHLEYAISVPFQCLYLLLSSTIMQNRSLAKNSSNTSSGDSGMSTVGPTGDVNVPILSGTVVFAHDDGRAGGHDGKEGGISGWTGDTGGTVEGCVPGDTRGDAVGENDMGRAGDVHVGGTGETGFEMGGDTRGDSGGETDMGRAGDSGSSVD